MPNSKPDTTEPAIQIQIWRDVELPGLPNFFRMTNGDVIPVIDLNKSEIQTIGRCWANALMEKWERKQT